MTNTRSIEQRLECIIDVQITVLFLKMEVIRHSVETLRTALISKRQDLIQLYSKYTEEERRLLEEAFLAGRPGSLFQPITVHGDSDWIRAQPEKPQDFESFYKDPHRKTPSARCRTIYIQTIGQCEGHVAAM